MGALPGFTEVPLIGGIDIVRRVGGRRTAGGNLEIGIESTKQVEALRRQYRPATFPPALPAGMDYPSAGRAIREVVGPSYTIAGRGEAERGAGGSFGPPGATLPPELAPNLRARRREISVRGFYPKAEPVQEPTYRNLPSVPPRASIPRVEREEYVTVTVPGEALHALYLYRRGGHEGTRIRRTDEQLIQAAAWALYTSRIYPLPRGSFVATMPRGGLEHRPAADLYRRGIRGEAYVPGTFPPNYVVPGVVAPTTVPVTTDTVAALIYFEGLWNERPAETFPPPRRERIADALRKYRWAHTGTSPALQVFTWGPPPGPPPRE